MPPEFITEVQKPVRENFDEQFCQIIWDFITYDQKSLAICVQQFIYCGLKPKLGKLEIISEWGKTAFPPGTEPSSSQT